MIFLGIDLGGSSVKAVLIDESGHYLARGTQAIPTQHPQSGHAEQNPLDWLEAMAIAVAQLWQNSPWVAADVTAMSITAGAHIGVLCDAHHNPLRPAILWSDQRAACEVAELSEHKDDIMRLSLHQPNASWTLAHLRWLWLYEYETLSATRHLLPAKDWLRAQLTGQRATDISDAIGLQLYDVTHQKWSPPLCALGGIVPDILPAIRSPYEIGGTISRKMAAQFHLKADMPIYIGSIDTSIEWLTIGGQATPSLKLASAGVIAHPIKTPHRAPPISCYPNGFNQGWYFASGMNSCTSALDWVRQHYLQNCSFNKMESLAKMADRGAGGALFHPYINGERAPHWSPHLRAELSGVSGEAAPMDVARAAYEGIALALYDVRLDFEQRTGIKIDHFTMLGGGTKSPFWLQLISDVQNVSLRVPHYYDAGFGAALFAAIAHGAQNYEDLHKVIEFSADYTPDANRHAFHLEQFARFDQRRAEMMSEMMAEMIG